MLIDENSSIKDLTNGEYSVLRYNSAGNNYSGELVEKVLSYIEKTGVDVTNTRIKDVGSTFRNIVLAYQKKFGLAETGYVDDDLLHDIYKRATQTTNSEITSDDDNYDYETEVEEAYDAHYDPFFLNNSDKIYRKNHKDIIISFGNGANTKTIKDVFMRSMSVQVDTSGNPISEVYNFIARDIKESDASEDLGKYTGEERIMSSSSDIKYSYESLFKDF